MQLPIGCKPRRGHGGAARLSARLAGLETAADVLYRAAAGSDLVADLQAAGLADQAGWPGGF